MLGLEAIATVETKKSLGLCLYSFVGTPSLLLSHDELLKFTQPRARCLFGGKKWTKNKIRFVSSGATRRVSGWKPLSEWYTLKCSGSKTVEVSTNSLPPCHSSTVETVKLHCRWHLGERCIATGVRGVSVVRIDGEETCMVRSVWLGVATTRGQTGAWLLRSSKKTQ